MIDVERAKHGLTLGFSATARLGADAGLAYRRLSAFKMPATKGGDTGRHSPRLHTQLQPFC
jgi:hypothetical protein